MVLRVNTTASAPRDCRERALAWAAALLKVETSAGKMVGFIKCVHSHHMVSTPVCWLPDDFHLWGVADGVRSRGHWFDPRPPRPQLCHPPPHLHQRLAGSRCAAARWSAGPRQTDQVAADRLRQTERTGVCCYRSAAATWLMNRGSEHKPALKCSFKTLPLWYFNGHLTNVKKINK